VVDVVEDERRPARRDPACEALPDRNAHAALDLLLDPAGGVGDELVRLPVEQEDGAGVRVERGGDPQEQPLEPLLERQVRERSVADGLEPPQALYRPGVLVLSRDKSLVARGRRRSFRPGG
jgi:hypothetical protein